ncbi:hypothetical protein MishRS11D_30700 [Methylomagnum ishizawai]|nr:hypothetical protein MishRS11D_30700 [Methylomagnum ishizawai]
MERMELRKRAEDALLAGIHGLAAESFRPETTEETRQYLERLLQELQVYDAELEIQNHELRIAQTELENSRNRYVDLFDFSPLGYLTLDKDGVIREINLTAAILFQRERQSILNHPLVHFVVPEDRQSLIGHLRRCQRREESSVTTELRIVGKSGASLPVELYSVAEPAVSDSGLFRTAMTDIARRKAIEEELLRARDEQERRLVELDAANATLAAILANMPVGLSITDAKGNLVTHNKTGLTLHGLSDDRAMDLGIGEYSQAFELRTLDGAILPLEQWPVSKALRGEFVRDFDLCLRNRLTGKEHFVSYTVAPVESRGNGLILYVVQDLAERRRAEEALRRSEELNRRTLQALPAHIAVIDSAGAIIAVNAAWTRFARDNAASGLSAVTIGANYLEVCARASASAPDTAEALAGIQAVLDGRLDQFEMEYRCPGPSEERWFHMNVVPYRIDGVGGAVISHLNITGRKQAEERLRQSEERLKERERMLSESQALAHIGSWAYDPVRDRVVWTDETYRLFGVSPGDFAHTLEAFLGLIHPDDWAPIRQWMETASAGQSPGALRLRVAGPGGRNRLLEGRGQLVPDGRGGPSRMIGTVQDITEREAAERALRESEARFRAMADNIAQLAWMADPDGSIFWYNRRWYEYTGGTPQTMMGEDWRSAHHPDHVERVTAHYRASIALGEPWEDIFPLLGVDGRYRWFLSRALPIRDGEGRTTLWFGTSTDITEQKEQQERIEHLAFHDVLTQLPNRAFFRERLAADLAQAERRGGPMAVFVLDLDHFKQINDSLGHLVGDALLREAARRMRACVREQDCVARQGGDEFMLVLPDTDADGAAHAAEKIVEALSTSFDICGNELHISCSLGISLYPDNGRDANGLIRNADVAMYRAKQNGRNGYQFFTEEMQREAIRTLGLEHQLRLALRRGELLLHYQPQVDIHNGGVVGCEALLRWRHSDGSLTGPESFIPLAEENGLIADIGLWVLHEAAMQAEAWERSGKIPYPVPVSVNLSAQQFRYDRQRSAISEQVARVLRDTGVTPGLLELEITETGLMEDSAWTAMTLNTLREMGVRVAIDDFGVGYSSLSYLKTFPVSRLKIDQSFIRNIAWDSQDEAIVDTIINLGRNFGLRVIAEGVETREQFNKLREKGCDEAQGFYFSEPLPAEELRAWLLRERP